MYNKKSTAVTGIIFTVFLLGLFIIISIFYSKNQVVIWEDFFIGTHAQTEFNIPVEGAVIRQQVVEPRLDLFADVIVDGTDPSSIGLSIELNLFEDVILNVHNMMSSEGYVLEDGKILMGEIEGDEFSQVVLVSDGNVLEGHVIVGNDTYLINTTAEGLVVITQIDPGAYPNDLHVDVITGLLDTKGANAMMAPIEIRNLQNAGEKSIVDIMVVYTLGAKNYSGNILARIEADVAALNVNLADSGVDIQIRLVHTELVNYFESGTTNDLYNLSGVGDAVLDEVHALRDQYYADLVVMIQSSANAGYCGIAYQIQRPENPYNNRYGFSIVEAMCMGGAMTFQHEVGHNMGNAHDIVNSGYAGSFEYSYGYQDNTNRFRTIMSYNCSGGCSRIPYFSNVTELYGSFAMGVPDQIDNARSMNNNAPWLAVFSEPPPPEPTATPEPTDTPTETYTPTATETSTVATTLTETSSPTESATGTLTQTNTPTTTSTTTSTSTQTSTNTMTPKVVSPTSTLVPSTSTPRSTSTVGPTATPLISSCRPNDNSKFEQELVDRINDERTKRGLQPLINNNGLADAARTHSREILCNGLQPGQGNGKSAFENLPGKGKGLTKKWENVTGDIDSVEELLESLLNDPEERANLLSLDYSVIGIGYADSGNDEIWTILYVEP